MSSGQKHIAVCICTFRRPDQLRGLLQRLGRQTTNGEFTFSLVVTDNDASRSAEPAVESFQQTGHIGVRYSCEPQQNIALARNRALSHATGDFVAFIDDDECPSDDWLAAMLGTCGRYEAAGVLGPVRPRFEEAPPRWILNGRFWERPEYATGQVMHWRGCRMGNVLLRRRILGGLQEVFDPAFGKGGEDVDFFRRMTSLGHVFHWCNEGAVYETVPAERCTRRYLIKRALLRGRQSTLLPIRSRLAAQSVVAIPVYLMVLPFTLFLGQHVFMKYCIKFFDHAGRLLALLGLNPVHER